jgi:hypothetical protein
VLNTVQEKHRVMAVLKWAWNGDPKRNHDADEAKGGHDNDSSSSPFSLPWSAGGWVVPLSTIVSPPPSPECRRWCFYADGVSLMFFRDRRSETASLHNLGECAKELGKGKIFCGAGRCGGCGQYSTPSLAKPKFILCFPNCYSFENYTTAAYC